MNPKRKKQTLDTAHRVYKENPNFSELGRIYDIHPMHFWKAIRQGYPSPKLARALGTTRKRVRFAADVSPELLAELRAEVDELQITHGELVEYLYQTWQESKF